MKNFKEEAIRFLNKEISKRKIERTDLELAFEEATIVEEKEVIHARMNYLTHEIVLLMGLKLKTRRS